MKKAANQRLMLPVRSSHLLKETTRSAPKHNDPWPESKALPAAERSSPSTDSHGN
jgi:hypothetical protein